MSYRGPEWGRRGGLVEGLLVWLLSMLAVLLLVRLILDQLLAVWPWIALAVVIVTAIRWRSYTNDPWR